MKRAATTSGSAKLRPVEEAAARVRSRDTLAVPLGPGQPAAFLHALGERESFDELTVFGALLIEPFRVFTLPGVRLLSGFFGPVERGLLEAGFDVEFVPADFRRFAPIAERLRPRVMATAASPPDADGRMSLALHAGATTEALLECGRDPARVLVVEINRALPRTRGLLPDHPHAIPLEVADVVVESDRPVFELPDREPSAVDRAVAAHAFRFIEDCCTLQTGIGGIPSGLAELLASGPGEDYGIHSEMFTTGLMRLHQAGKVTNRKGIFDGHSIATFAAGTRELYDWLDGNGAVRFLPVDRVNDPGVIAANRKMVAINGALAVDLYGQIAADTLGVRQFSGVGGHHDFSAAASRAPGGRSLVCLPSTAGSAGRNVSRIVASFADGSLVTTPRHDVDLVITEHGVAELAGRTVQERADALIAVADPAHRASLREAWRTSGARGPGSLRRAKR
jgi:acyl-CoA hydrolase